MTVGRYLVGVAATLCVVSALLTGAVALRAFLMPAVRGAVARLAEAVIAVALLELTLELLGTVRLLALAPTVAGSLAVGLGARSVAGHLTRQYPNRVSTGHRAGASASGAGQEPPPTRLTAAVDRIALLVALLAAGVVLAEWSGITLQSLHRGVLGFDSVSYHLPWAASFAHTGQTTSIRYTDFDWLTGFYPATSELVHACGIVLMGNDILSPVLNLVWLALALLAAWCIGAARGTGPATLTAGAVAMATPMMFFSTAGSADSDAMGIFTVLAAVALWLNAPLSSGQPQTADAATGGPRPIAQLALLPAAAAAGLALAVKLNMVIPALAVSVAVLLEGPRQRRGQRAALWLGAMLLTGGYWYLRNLVQVGNPLPYFRFGVLPVPTPGPMQAGNNFAIWDYHRHLSAVWQTFRRALHSGLGPWWFELLAVAVIGATLCVLLGPDRKVRLLGLAALAAIVGYIFTPGSASGPYGHPLGFNWNLRYSTPALALALTSAPLSLPFVLRWRRWLAMSAMTALFLVIVLEPQLWGPGYSLSGQVSTAAGVLLLGLLAVTVPWRSGAVARRRWRVAAIGAAITLAGLGLGFAYHGERIYLKGRYHAQPGLPVVTAFWRWANAQHHERIGMVGTYSWYFGYPAFGADASNTVLYLGVHGPHGAFTPFATCRAFREAVNVSHVTYLVTAGIRVQWYHRIVPSAEQGWISRDPQAIRLEPAHGYSPIEIWRLTGRLDPACPAAGVRAQHQARATADRALRYSS